MPHYVIVYDRKTGAVKDTQEFEDWNKAFVEHEHQIDNNNEEDVSVSLVTAPSMSHLKQYYKAFFHTRCPKC